MATAPPLWRRSWCPSYWKFRTSWNHRELWKLLWIHHAALLQIAQFTSRTPDPFAKYLPRYYTLLGAGLCPCKRYAGILTPSTLERNFLGDKVFLEKWGRESHSDGPNAMELSWCPINRGKWDTSTERKCKRKEERRHPQVKERGLQTFRRKQHWNILISNFSLPGIRDSKFCWLNHPDCGVLLMLALANKQEYCLSF